MGAWGYTVLENDAALDAMGELEKSKNLKSSLMMLLCSDYIEEKLLAVEVIDISLNGINESFLGSFYQYESWFRSVAEQPMPDLREKALNVLEEIILKEDANNLWVASCRDARRQLLLDIKSRLLN